MGPHMKTTIELGDALIMQAKQVAAQENTTLRALVEAGLRHVLAQRSRSAAPYRLRRVVVHGEGMNPELQGADWQRLRDLAYGDPAA